MGIAARLCPFTTSFVQRFVISGGKLGNHCMLFPRNDPGAAVILDFRGQTWQSLQRLPGIGSPACSGRCGNEVRIRFHSSLPQRRKVPPAVVVAATRSASDSNFRCCKGEWFRLQLSLRQRGPNPILIFAAAKENGSACSCRSGNEVRVRY